MGKKKQQAEKARAKAALDLLKQSEDDVAGMELQSQQFLDEGLLGPHQTMQKQIDQLKGAHNPQLCAQGIKVPKPAQKKPSSPKAAKKLSAQSTAIRNQQLEVLQDLESKLEELQEQAEGYREQGLLSQYQMAMAMSASARENATTLRRNLEASGTIPPARQPPEATTPPIAAVADTTTACSSSDGGFVTSALAASYCTRSLSDGTLEVVVHLPTATNAAEIDAEFTEADTQLSVLSSAGTLLVVVPLGGAVDEDEATFKFDKQSRKLTVHARRIDHRPEHCIETVASQLMNSNHCVLEPFLDVLTARGLQEEVLEMHRGGQLIEGEVRGGSEKKIRGDMMGWVDFDKATPSMKQFMRVVDGLVMQLADAVPELHENNRMLMRQSAMVSCYPGNGTTYVRHVDNRTSNGRVLTTIMYLNSEWEPEHMGSLRLFLKAGTIDVEPVFNRFVVFWSDARCPHEVLPAHDLRYATSIWYLDTSEAMADMKNDTMETKSSEEEKAARMQDVVNVLGIK